MMRPVTRYSHPDTSRETTRVALLSWMLLLVANIMILVLLL